MEVDMVLWNPGTRMFPVVLGSPLFLQAIVDIDFDADRLSIVQPESFNPPPEAPIAVSVWRGTPLVHMKIGNHPELVCAMVDTGFDGGLALSDDVVKELSLSYDSDGRRIVYAAGAAGVRQERRVLEVLPEVRLGGSVYTNVEATHVPESGECLSRIGTGLLGQSRLVFDLKNRRMWVLPRASRSSQ
jgi:predicted aspartyl protease